jgi:hypothetical protein
MSTEKRSGIHLSLPPRSRLVVTNPPGLNYFRVADHPTPNHTLAPNGARGTSSDPAWPDITSGASCGEGPELRPRFSHRRQRMSLRADGSSCVRTSRPTLNGNSRVCPLSPEAYMGEVCEHVDEIRPVEPSSPGCQECLQLGDDWVHLRLCLHS